MNCYMYTDINGIDSRRTSPGTDNLLQLGEPLYLGGTPDTTNVRGNIVEAIVMLVASETYNLQSYQ